MKINLILQSTATHSVSIHPELKMIQFLFWALKIIPNSTQCKITIKVPDILETATKRIFHISFKQYTYSMGKTTGREGREPIQYI